MINFTPLVLNLPRLFRTFRFVIFPLTYICFKLISKIFRRATGKFWRWPEVKLRRFGPNMDKGRGRFWFLAPNPWILTLRWNLDNPRAFLRNWRWCLEHLWLNPMKVEARVRRRGKPPCLLEFSCWSPTTSPEPSHLANHCRQFPNLQQTPAKKSRIFRVLNFPDPNQSRRKSSKPDRRRSPSRSSIRWRKLHEGP